MEDISILHASYTPLKKPNASSTVLLRFLLRFNKNTTQNGLLQSALTKTSKRFCYSRVPKVVIMEHAKNCFCSITLCQASSSTLILRKKMQLPTKGHRWWLQFGFFCHIKAFCRTKSEKDTSFSPIRHRIYFNSGQLLKTHCGNPNVFPIKIKRHLPDWEKMPRKFSFR